MVEKNKELYEHLPGFNPALVFLSSIFCECISIRPTTKTNIPTKIINNIPYVIYLSPYLSNNNEITENIKNKIMPNMNIISLNMIYYSFIQCQQRNYKRILILGEMFNTVAET